VALVRDPGPGLLAGLSAQGIEIVDYSPLPAEASPYVERFIRLRQFLFGQRRQSVQFRWVLVTDVRDVCFQRDPLDFLLTLHPPRLVLSPEGLRYEHADWNAANLQAAFGPETLETLRAAAPNNVGVLAGSHYAIEGLALVIEHLARAAATEVADQAALNLITESLAASLWAHRAQPEEPWACQAGVMADPTRIARNRFHLLGPEPVWRDGLVRTINDEPYAIVHQYDRVPDWHEAIMARFGA
jgi:hypothetical protein